MKIAIVAGNRSGGAGIAAYRMVQCLKDNGYDATFFFINGLKSNLKSWEHKIDIEYIKPKNTERTPLSNTLFTWDTEQRVSFKSLIEFDIIHFHWIAGMISHQQINNLSARNIGLVWTLHDTNPFTGGCHYTANCLQFINGCVDCPQLKGEQAKNESRSQYVNRLAAIRNLKQLVITAPSEWLSHMARQSLIFRDNAVYCLRNPFPSNFINKLQQINHKNSQNTSCCYMLNIILGSLTNDERRKGIDLGLLAIKEFLTIHHDIHINLHIIGNTAQNINLDRCNLILHGKVDADNIGEILSQCDISIVPSLEENYSNFIAECIISNLFTIGFDIGGNKEMVKHRRNGFLSPVCKGALGLANGLNFYISRFKEQDHERASNAVINEVRCNHVVDKLISIYNNALILSRKHCHLDTLIYSNFKNLQSAIRSDFRYDIEEFNGEIFFWTKEHFFINKDSQIFEHIEMPITLTIKWIDIVKICKFSVLQNNYGVNFKLNKKSAIIYLNEKPMHDLEFFVNPTTFNNDNRLLGIPLTSIEIT